MNKAIAGGLCAALLLSGCATEGAINASTGLPMTEVERAQQNCKVSVGVGAVLGAAIGAAASSRNRASGAAIGGGAGALLGAGFCGVMLAMANEKDRAKIAELRQAALTTGTPQRAQYYGDDGKLRIVRVAALSAEPPAKAATGLTNCRRITTDVQLQGAGNAHLGELTCRNPQGDYVTVKG